MESQSDKREEAKLVRDLFERMHPGWTDEDLLNRPSEGQHFCNVVRAKLRCNLDDFRITGHLMSARKKGGSSYGKPHKPIRLAVELQAVGIEMEPTEFVDRITELFHGLYRGATDEAMLRRPKEGKAFCEAVRANLGCCALPERLICQTLVNNRKSRKVMA